MPVPATQPGLGQAPAQVRPSLGGAGHAAVGTPASAQQPLSPTGLSPISRKYATISSSEQRQSYKNDFNAEYSEYRDLHARIERITRRFTQLDAQLRQLSQGSEEYEVGPLACTPPWGDRPISRSPTKPEASRPSPCPPW